MKETIYHFDLTSTTPTKAGQRGDLIFVNDINTNDGTGGLMYYDGTDWRTVNPSTSNTTISAAFADTCSVYIVSELVVSSSYASSSVSSSDAINSRTATSSSYGLSSSYAILANALNNPQSAVTLAGNPTGSCLVTGSGFTTDAEFVSFVSVVSASAISFNDLVTKLKAKGIIA